MVLPSPSRSAAMVANLAFGLAVTKAIPAGLVAGHHAAAFRESAS